MAKKYHPDQNRDDPLAAAKFMQVKKAYDALTNEQAKANYEKYGNPDGPQTTKVHKIDIDFHNSNLILSID